MCKCIVGWVVDEEVAGTHNVKPVTCAEYTAALEELVRSGNSDSLDLERVQKTHGVFRDTVIVAIDPVGDDSDIQRFGWTYDENAQYPTLVQPYIADQVKDVQAWKDEIMAQLEASRNARMMALPGYEFTFEPQVGTVENGVNWIGEYEREHYVGIAPEAIEQLRKMGYAPPGLQ